RAAGKLDRSYIVVLESPAGKADATTDDLQRKRGFRARLRFRRALRGFAAQLTEGQAERLRDEPAVASVTPDRPVQALGEVDLVPGDSAPTGVLRVGAATPVTARQASSATVAVLDTGIDLSHPDLNAADGINCVAPGTPAQDDEGHGTHVAGTISARNDGRGVVGVAPGTRTHAVKVLNDEAEGSTSQVLCGIDWVTATRADTDPSNDISVINLSLGGSGPPVAPCATTRDPLHRAICASTRAGVTYVVAAGNEGRDFDNARTPRLPAAYPEVLTATAMSDSDGAPGALGGAPACRPSQIDDVYASFSNYATTTAGAAHTVAGPGVCIRSTWPGSGYTTISGTSMASPHVAGAVALCLGEAGDAGPCAGLSPAGIVARMRGTGRQNAEHGFLGDPLRPVAGRYFGPLAWAGPPGTERAEDVPVPTAPTESGSGAPAAAPPQPAPAGPPVADTPPAPTAADRTAPTATLSIRRRRLSAVLRRGLGVTLSCSEGCVAAVEVWLPGRTARRLKLSRGATRRIARRSPVRLAASTRKGVVLKLSRAARARLARARGVTLRVKVAVSDAGGNRRAVARRARVRR
ncbi:MAG TPA: S8 family serine peptidase, partial [Thermoleophilaceae bacterium]|nr:S8 family serine peptidase [Thermoleophilaceae bacterium]